MKGFVSPMNHDTTAPPPFDPFLLMCAIWERVLLVRQDLADAVFIWWIPRHGRDEPLWERVSAASYNGKPYNSDYRPLPDWERGIVTVRYPYWHLWRDLPLDASIRLAEALALDVAKMPLVHPCGDCYGQRRQDGCATCGRPPDGASRPVESESTQQDAPGTTIADRAATALPPESEISDGR